MEIPAQILWGVAGFVIVSGVKILFKLLKDVDQAHLKIRQLDTELKILRQQLCPRGKVE